MREGLTRAEVEEVLAWVAGPDMPPPPMVRHAIGDLAAEWLRRSGATAPVWRAGQAVLLTERDGRKRAIQIKAVSQIGVALFVEGGGGERRFRRSGKEMAGDGWIESATQ